MNKILKYLARKTIAQFYNELFECDSGKYFVKGIEYGMKLRKVLE